MSVDLHVSPVRMAAGLLVAAAVAWMLLLLQSIAWPVVQAAVLNRSEDVPTLAQVWRFAFLYLLFGFPIVLVLCFVTGFPVWLYFDSRKCRKAHHAALAGAIAGLFAALIVVGFVLLSAWSGSYSEATNAGDIYIDGMPTQLAWWAHLRLVLAATAIGAMSGLGAWIAVLKRR